MTRKVFVKGFCPVVLDSMRHLFGFTSRFYGFAGFEQADIGIINPTETPKLVILPFYTIGVEGVWLVFQDRRFRVSL